MFPCSHTIIKSLKTPSYNFQHLYDGICRQCKKKNTQNLFGIGHPTNKSTLRIQGISMFLQLPKFQSFIIRKNLQCEIIT